MKRQLSNLIAVLAIIIMACMMSCQQRYTVPKPEPMPGCALFHSEDNPADNMTDIDLKSAYIVGQLERNGDIPRFENKIIVTTFVDINNLNQTSMFGRLIAEEILSQLRMKDYRVTDVREMKSIVMSNKVGELYLSRSGLPQPGNKIDITPKSFNFDYTNSLIVAGTYQVEPCEVFVNVRLISPEQAEVVSVASVKIPRTKLIKYLLSKQNELKDEPMPSIPLRQNEPVVVATPKPTPAPTPTPVKKAGAAKHKAKKKVKRKVPASPAEPVKPEAAPKPEAEAKPEAEVKVDVIMRPKEPVSPTEPVKPKEPVKPDVPVKK
ncbi:FlgO family outer membrane protein [Candidatus Magnetominusculus dajiuhuensis]|uniref:FlgO family outer membrane protein n=1 Tax=Candidatus Magnetominusculus dajiuhuensis TaxID=3137712 RepID=UPI003B42B91A